MELTNQQQQAEADAELTAQIEAASRDELIGLIHTYRAEYTACKKQLDASVSHVSEQAALIREYEEEIKEAEEELNEYDKRLTAMEQENASLKNGEALSALQKKVSELTEALQQQPCEDSRSRLQAQAHLIYTPSGEERADAAERRAEIHKRAQEEAAKTEKRIRAEVEGIEAKIEQWQDSVEKQQEHIFRLEARVIELKAATKKHRAMREVPNEKPDEKPDEKPPLRPIVELQEVKEHLKRTRDQVRATIKEVRAQQKLRDEARTKLERHIKRTAQANELYAREQARHTK